MKWQSCVLGAACAAMCVLGLGCSEGASSRSAAASSSASTATPRLAHLEATCAPWDGAGMLLTVDDVEACSTGDRPRLSFTIYEGLPIATGKAYRLTATSQAGAGTRCAGGGAPCEVAKSVELVFDQVDEQKATGHYTVAFKDGSSLSERFVAGKCGGPANCGGAAIPR